MKCNKLDDMFINHLLTNMLDMSAHRSKVNLNYVYVHKKQGTINPYNNSNSPPNRNLSQSLQKFGTSFYKSDLYYPAGLRRTPGSPARSSLNGGHDIGASRILGLAMEYMYVHKGGENSVHCP